LCHRQKWICLQSYYYANLFGWNSSFGMEICDDFKTNFEDVWDGCSCRTYRTINTFIQYTNHSSCFKKRSTVVFYIYFRNVSEIHPHFIDLVFSYWWRWRWCRYIVCALIVTYSETRFAHGEFQHFPLISEFSLAVSSSTPPRIEPGASETEDQRLTNVPLCLCGNMRYNCCIVRAFRMRVRIPNGTIFLYIYIFVLFWIYMFVTSIKRYNGKMFHDIIVLGYYLKSF